MTRVAASKTVTVFFECSLFAMLASGFFALLGSGELDTLLVVFTGSVLLLHALTIGGILKFKIPAFLLGAIATTELVAAALLSTRLSFFLFLTLFVLSAIAAFTSGEIVRSLRGSSAISRPALIPLRLAFMSVGLFAGILLMTVAMFFILPRTARAAMQRFAPPHYHLRGLGSDVTLGELGQLKQNGTSVMHVRSYTERPLDGLHWRGSTLSHFDGARWSTPFAGEERLMVEDEKLLLKPVRGSRPGLILGYAVELSDLAPDAMFFAGIPQTISIQQRALYRSPSGTIRASRLGMPVLHYGAYSLLESDGLPDEPPVPLSDNERRDFLDLPALDARIATLAREWAAGETDARRMAQMVESHLQQDYRYTLELLDAPVSDPLAHFLFTRRKGHCEYFASSMAVMLRTLGIPSRVVTGFYGGIFNSITGWQVLRASDAHSWVEAWLPGRGWTAFDPTPADPTAVAPPELLTKAALLLDAADQFWRDWVLSYDFNRQVMLASRAQSAGRMWQFSDWTQWADARALGSQIRKNPGWWIAVPTIPGLAIGAAIHGPACLAWWKRRSRLARAQRGEAQAADATLLYERMLQLLERSGWKRPPWLTPQEFARTIPAPSELSLLVEDLTTAYNEVRFGGHPDVAPRMARLLRRIETLLA